MLIGTLGEALSSEDVRTLLPHIFAPNCCELLMMKAKYCSESYHMFFFHKKVESLLKAVNMDQEGNINYEELVDLLSGGKN